MKSIRGKNELIISIATLLIIISGGCATGNKGADKVEINPEGQANVGYANTSSKVETTTTKTAGRDITEGSRVGGDQTNDSDVIKAMIEANKELNKQMLENEKANAHQEKENAKGTEHIYWLIIAGILMLLLHYIQDNNKFLNKLLEAREKDEEREDNQQEKVLNKVLDSK
jgi:hypothetical protein